MSFESIERSTSSTRPYAGPLVLASAAAVQHVQHRVAAAFGAVPGREVDVVGHVAIERRAVEHDFAECPGDGADVLRRAWLGTCAAMSGTGRAGTCGVAETTAVSASGVVACAGRGCRLHARIGAGGTRNRRAKSARPPERVRFGRRWQRCRRPPRSPPGTGSSRKTTIADGRQWHDSQHPQPTVLRGWVQHAQPNRQPDQADAASLNRRVQPGVVAEGHPGAEDTQRQRQHHVRRIRVQRVLAQRDAGARPVHAELAPRTR